MTINHLRGSLAKNILDITKGGSCPKIKPTRRYSVLRYFSRMKDDTYSVSGPVGDGGYLNDSGVADSAPPFVFYYKHTIGPPYNLNLNDNIPNGSSNFAGENALNICNRREILSASEDNYLGDQANPSIQNIQLANEVIEADGSGYYNYNLLKKNHTMDIIPAGSETPVSKTAELMEYVYLHAFIPKCRAGQLYIELEDFELEGDTENDYLIYCYYWETTTDQIDIHRALQNTGGFFSDNDNFLLTDTDNTVCKVFKCSQVQGVGADKKLIIWLNRNKTRNEKFAVNVLIGLKPQDLRRDETVRCNGSVEQNPTIVYDECDDILFKFKKATIKIKKFQEEVNNQPITPYFGFKDLHDTSDAGETDYISISTQALNSAGQAVAINTQSGIVEFGPPDGGFLLAAPYYWQDNITYFSGGGTPSGGFFPPSDYLTQISVNGCISQFSLLRFLKLDVDQIDPTQNYILKLPPITNMSGWNVDVGGGSYVVGPDTVYYDIFGTHATDYVIKIYCGEYPTKGAGYVYPNYKTFLDSLVLLHTFALEDIIEPLVEINSGMQLSTGNPTDGIDPVVGTPDYGFEKIFVKKNKYKYVEFSGADVASVVFKNFYISLERTSQSIKTISYAPVGNGDPSPYTFYYPAGYTENESLPMEYCTCAVIAEYVRSKFVSGLYSTYYKNYDAMIFQAPQIINKNETPEPENYQI